MASGPDLAGGEFHVGAAGPGAVHEDLRDVHAVLDGCQLEAEHVPVTAEAVHRLREKPHVGIPLEKTMPRKDRALPDEVAVDHPWPSRPIKITLRGKGNLASYKF